MSSRSGAAKRTPASLFGQNDQPDSLDATLGRTPELGLDDLVVLVRPFPQDHACNGADHEVRKLQADLVGRLGAHFKLSDPAVDGRGAYVGRAGPTRLTACATASRLVLPVVKTSDQRSPDLAQRHRELRQWPHQVRKTRAPLSACTLDDQLRKEVVDAVGLNAPYRALRRQDPPHLREVDHHRGIRAQSPQVVVVPSAVAQSLALLQPLLSLEHRAELLSNDLLERVAAQRRGQLFLVPVQQRTVRRRQKQRLIRRDLDLDAAQR